MEIINSYSTQVMKKVYITHDVPSSFRQTVRRLTFFHNADIICDSDNLGHPSTFLEVLALITELQPTLVITKNRDLAITLRSVLSNRKVILLRNCQSFSCDRLFLANAFDIEVFMASKCFLFEMA